MIKLKKMSLVLCFIIAGCYTATPPLISALSTGNYWETSVGEVGTGAEVMIMPKGTYASIAPQVLGVQLWQYVNYQTKYLDCTARKNYRFSTINLTFYKLPNGQFNTGKSYIIIDNRKYQLHPLNTNGDITKPDLVNTENTKRFSFQVPVSCGSLNGTIFEMFGIYSNGKELPPIKFRINLLNQAGIKS
ncbi:MAG: hypothetical protein Q4F75_01100 [Pseudomonadota bacterium]|nr:hypothetical protein [Pseudomonadota bacterium]